MSSLHDVLDLKTLYEISIQTPISHLQIRVLVVVDAHEVVPGLRREVRDERGLAAAGRALEEHGVLPAGGGRGREEGGRDPGRPAEGR